MNHTVLDTARERGEQTSAFLVLTFAGVTNLWLAVLADVGMSLLVTFNSLRLMRGDRAAPAPADHQSRRAETAAA